jgi:hypothetical protein
MVELDVKNISILVGIASAVLTIVLKFMPRPSDQLKHDLELLKLAREARANYLPLQRSVDAQVRQIYMNTEIGIKRYFEELWLGLFFSTTFFLIVSGIFGAITTYILKLLFSIPDERADNILLWFLVIGIGLGISSGVGLARKWIDEVREELKQREQAAAMGDEEVLQRLRATDPLHCTDTADRVNAAPASHS